MDPNTTQKLASVLKEEFGQVCGAEESPELVAIQLLRSQRAAGVSLLVANEKAALLAEENLNLGNRNSVLLGQNDDLRSELLRQNEESANALKETQRLALEKATECDVLTRYLGRIADAAKADQSNISRDESVARILATLTTIAELRRQNEALQAAQLRHNDEVTVLVKSLTKINPGLSLKAISNVVFYAAEQLDRQAVVIAELREDLKSAEEEAGRFSKQCRLVSARNTELLAEAKEANAAAFRTATRNDELLAEVNALKAAQLSSTTKTSPGRTVRLICHRSKIAFRHLPDWPKTDLNRSESSQACLHISSRHYRHWSERHHMTTSTFEPKYPLVEKWIAEFGEDDGLDNPLWDALRQAVHNEVLRAKGCPSAPCDCPDFPSPETKAIFEMATWLTRRLTFHFFHPPGEFDTYNLLPLLSEVLVRLNRLEGKSLTATPESLRESK